MRKLWIAVFLLGCTKGGVWSAVDGAPVRGATVEVSLLGAAESQVLETSEVGWGRDFFALGPRTTTETWGGSELEPNQWYRWSVSRDGFAPRVFYRYHPGYAGACEFSCPDGSTNCCHREDFTLWPVGTPHELAPDLVVDPATLARETYVQCVNLGGDDEPEVIAVRSSIVVANVGDGDLRVQSARAGVVCSEDRPCAPGFGCEGGVCVADVCDAGDRICPGELVCRQGRCTMPSCIAGEECRSDRCDRYDRCEPTVEQHVAGVDGRAGEVVTLETYMFNDGQTSELLAFAALHLIPADCPAENPDDCALVTGPRRTYCVEAEDRFDEELDGASPLGAQGCKAGTQVLGRGQSVSYAHDEPGQVLLLGNPTEAREMLGQPLAVAASVDPADVLVERQAMLDGELVEERENNRARMRLDLMPIVDLTDFRDLCRTSVSPSCRDCVPILDCSQCQAGTRDGVIHRCATAPNLTEREEEMCGDYPPALSMSVASVHER